MSGEGLSRRCFLKAGALVGCSLSSVSWLAGFAEAGPAAEPSQSQAGAAARTGGVTRTVHAGCPGHNCGGRCLLTLQVRDGVIVSIESDERPGDSVEAPQLRACIRGRAYRRRQYHADRLLAPLKRVGPRGEGRFEPVSWDEALDRIAAELTRVKTTYGNAALFVPYGTGSYSQTNGRQVAQRLVNLIGGSLGHYNNYSWACMARATETVYGTQVTGNQRQDWVNARLILMWGWNPSEMRDGTNTEFYLRAARSRGARIVCIDPRHTLSAVSLADEWVPIRPGTDAAMMSAMAHVIVTEHLQDAAFVESHCLGFDASQMPESASRAESYKDYLLGTKDRVPKTPAWAEAITGVPRDTIARLAREYATKKPGVLYQGYGMQRRAFGEQVVRAGCALAAITGNVGLPGSWAGGMAFQAPNGGPLWSVFPTGANPVKASIPTFLWTEAVTRGPELRASDGLRGVERLETGIKLIWAVASNALINQHGNTNRTAAILRNEKLVECLIVQDNFLTPTARFADLVLPACTQLETWGVEDGWKYGDEVLLMPKVVEPPGQARSDYRICAGLAAKLGVEAAYTEGRDERAWVAWSIDRLKTLRYPALPDTAALEGGGSVHQAAVEQPVVALADFRRDPKQFPLPTSSGRIELFSPELAALNRPAEIPAVPKYIQEWESPFGPEAQLYPLQVVGHHTLARVHSTMARVDWLEEAFPQRVFINPLDAASRKIANGDEVRVFNARGELRLRCRVTPRIMPGVIAIAQGAWWTPGADGIDRGGCINVLTSERWTPLAFGNAQHTVMAQVASVQRAGQA